MNLLTDEELIAGFGDPLSENALRAMHKAVALAVKKLAQGVSVEPVAEVFSKHGDPERFGEREIEALVNLKKIPYNTKLYTAEQLAAARVQGGKDAIERLSTTGVEPVAEVRTLHYGSLHPPVAFTGVVLSDKTDYYSLPFRENAQLYTAAQLAAARVQALNDSMNCYSPDDSATDWMDKIRALIGGANHG